MDLIEYIEKRRSDTIVEKEASFECTITDKVNTLEDIYDKFKDYRFWEYLDNFREEFNCQLKSDIKYFLFISYKGKGIFYGVFLIASFSIPNRYDTDFLPIIYQDERINNTLKNELYDTIKVEAYMKIKFLLFCSLDALSEYEAEQIEDLYDEGDDDEDPPIIEKPFILDTCSICLSEKSDILLVPCLHKTYCSQCEENGKLIKCPTCRKIITQKIKI